MRVLGMIGRVVLIGLAVLLGIAAAVGAFFGAASVHHVNKLAPTRAFLATF